MRIIRVNSIKLKLTRAKYRILLKFKVHTARILRFPLDHRRQILSCADSKRTVVAKPSARQTAGGSRCDPRWQIIVWLHIQSTLFHERGELNCPLIWAILKRWSAGENMADCCLFDLQDIGNSGNQNPNLFSFKNK